MIRADVNIAGDCGNLTRRCLRNRTVMESVYPPPTSRGHNQTGLMTGGVRLSP